MRVLVVAPHMDDESFGCLGTLLKHKESEADIYFLWFTQARGTDEGAQKIVAYFNAFHYFANLPDQHLDVIPLVDIIKHVETAVKLFKPDIAYIPFIGDLNADHRRVSEAAMVACRPYKPNSPNEVLMYCIPGTTELGLRPFVTDMEVLIDAEKKIDLLKRWYPGELINGRSEIKNYERFERWPR